ncbi:MAG: hypothetical protein Q8O67_06710 [Deltaproteobacteria bacterium]|nr:hypothetical protein [Deltaproteobacteria bacterium]
MSPVLPWRVVVVALIAVAAGGCLKPWLKRLGTAPEARPTPALITGMVARFDGPASLVDLAQKSGLDEFGRASVDPLRKAMELEGYTLTFDKARATALDGVPFQSEGTVLDFNGQWRHPDASSWAPDMVESPLVAPRELISMLKTEDGEHFAFVGLDINDVGNIFREPIVIARVTVYDAAGVKVLDLRGIGTGNTSFLFADRSPANLRIAFDEAVASLATVTEEPL